MSKSELAVSNALAIANDSAHGYDQGSRWGPDYDCSSLIITAWENAGVPVKSRGATYTGNMRPVFIACGFRDVTASVNLATGAGMQRGDVLLNILNHTAMYIGNGMLVHARGNEYGGVTGGRSGDQTGSEICTQGYFNYGSTGWDCVLRYEESPVGTTAPTTGTASPTSGTDADGYYTVKAGDSLWAIAQRLLGSGARHREIMNLNNMSSSVIHPGDRLRIPGMAKPEFTETPSTGANTQTGGDNAQQSVGSDSGALESGVYVVQKGDTLWGIAKRYLGSGLRFREIQKLNGLVSFVIYPGERLKLPEK